MRPGKKTFAISLPKKEKRSLNLKNKQYFIHNIIVPNREEDIPVFEKPCKSSKYERNFEKALSEFRDWHADQPEDPTDCMQHDIDHWNCERFIKDDEERALLEEEVKAFAGPLKNIFI